MYVYIILYYDVCCKFKLMTSDCAVYSLVVVLPFDVDMLNAVSRLNPNFLHFLPDIIF